MQPELEAENSLLSSAYIMNAADVTSVPYTFSLVILQRTGKTFPTSSTSGDFILTSKEHRVFQNKQAEFP